MKRLILITAIVVYCLLAVSVLFPVKSENNGNQVGAVTSSEVAEPEVKYVMAISEGFVTVYDEKGKLIKKTDTLVSGLPRPDQKKLKQGIAIYNEKELSRLLEDFCS